MRFVLALLLLAAPAPAHAHALEPLAANGGVFGLHDGVYDGEGRLESPRSLVPDLPFTSVRRLDRGVIEARTRARFLGLQVAEASARLRVKPTGTGRFELLDLDRNDQRAGEGRCDRDGCTFEVVVMGGELTLKETWVPDGDGFLVQNGSQVFKGIPATYEGRFHLRDY